MKINRHNFIYTMGLFFAAFMMLTSCAKIAVMATPEKQAEPSKTELAKIAKDHFWKTLHDGHYNDLPETTRLLTAAYLQNPNDPELAGFLGFAHIWKIAERSRQTELQPTIINHIVLARRFFKDATILAPDDARFLGFYGDSTLVEGKILADKREQVRGYFILQRAIIAWPEFNYFTAGYPMSTLPANSKNFKEGLEWQWKTLDVCIGEKIDQKNPDYSPYMKLETTAGSKRACWNSWIAPYNFEGFFLNMGDMLVKSGDWQTAIKIYRNAQLASNYKAWPYRAVLEDRIQHAEEYVKRFNEEKPLTDKPEEPTVMFNSHFSCMGCHQQAKS